MKTFKIGMPSLIELPDFNDTVDLCRELKLDFIELNMNFPSNFIENLSPEHLMSVSKKYNLFYTIHMPDDADMGVFFDYVRNGYIKLALDTIEWASKSNVKILNFHVIEGAVMTLPHKKIYVYDEYSDVFMKKFVDSFMKIGPAAVANKVLLCIENSGNFGKLFVQQTLDKVLEIEGIGITWDVGHDSSKGYTDNPYLMKVKNKISHMHFHDTLGNKDHLIPFTGELDIFDRITFAKNNNLSTVIEVKTIEALKESIYVLRHKNLI